MAKIIPFGQPANEGERDAIYYLKRLPDDFEIFHNLEIKQNKETFEVDLVILAPQCVFVVDVKGTRGQIEVVGSRWHPENRQAYSSPVAKLRNIAKVLNTLFKDSNRLDRELGRVHVHAVTLMIAEDVQIIDLDDRDSNHITYCDQRCITYFQSSDFIPDHRLTDIRAFFPDIRRSIQGKAVPKSSPARYRDWQVEEELGRTKRYIEYRARHLLRGVSGWTARLRVYRADPYQDQADRETEEKLISNVFESIYQVPKHPNILSVQDFFRAEDGDCFVLVTEDIPGQALRQNIKTPHLLLNQKFGYIEQVLIALDHAHKHGVIHRNLTPDTILIGVDGQVRLTGFDYARVVDRSSTIAHDISVDDLENDAVYQATECYRNPAMASVKSDLFATGLVFYELLTGQPAFESAEQICDQMAAFSIKPSSLQPDLSDGIDKWLQKLCAFEPIDRFSSADEALQEWITLATLQNVDLANLPPNTPIDNRYRVIKRLGHPGSFAVAYKVLDSLDDSILVLKLVTRDRRSVYERLRQEYKTLRQIPEHPHIVKVMFAGHLKDDTPFIIFEYVEGQDVEHCLISNSIVIEEAIEIARQTAIGLAHLHQHGVYHQDIKPSNLLLTDQGIRIIDFNIAVSDRDEVTISAGTRKYLPPDFNSKLEQTTAEKIDRDLYALGIVFYECVTGCYPFEETIPPLGKFPRDPNEVQKREDLSDELVQLLLKVIAPKRGDRFTTAAEFLSAISAINSLRQTGESESENIVYESTSIEIVDPYQVLSIPQVQDLSLEIVEIPESQLAISEIISNTLVVESTALTSVKTNFQTSLFEGLSPDFSPGSFSTQDLPSKSVILDPTGLYLPASGCVEIRTEVEWIQSFFQSDAIYWVTGSGKWAKRLCDWTREWLRVWNKLDAILEEKQDPRIQLQSLFASVPIPDEWTDREILQLATAISAYSPENPIAHLLADLIEGDRQVWFDSPSVHNLARWLAIQVPDTYKPLERIWQNKVGEGNSELTSYYQTDDKLQLIRQWIGLVKPSAEVRVLDCYPLPIPSFLVGEFRAFWESQLIQNEGRAIDELIPNQQSGMEQIAPLAYTVLKSCPKWITKERKRKISSYLKPEDIRSLDDLQPPIHPEMLNLEVNPKDAMKWVTDQYLPFRRWDAALNSSLDRPRLSDSLADSFVIWLLKHYPELKFTNSILNYSVASLVQDLCETNPVLWVVVDGLGWLDHQELLTYLTRNNSFSVETPLQPRISILPTKTEYAKWSLYTQLPPSHPAWVPDAGKGFPMVGAGKRYTDNNYKRGALHRDLQKKAYQLYCWDTDKFDHLYHTEQNWQNLYQVQRPHVLEGIAKDIEYSVNQYPHPEQVKIVIASDHGQMIGEVKHLTDCPEGLESKGRMAIGKTDDPRFVVLDAERYELPHDISVVRGAACLNAFSYSEKKEIIGSHGGLFPEEVVVGVSVLRQYTARLTVQVLCRGNGEAGQSGVLMLEVNNLNTVPLTQLCIYIYELNGLKTGHPLDIEIPAGQKVQHEILITNCPELLPNHKGNEIILTGELTFCFAGLELGTAKLNSASSLTVKQLFNSGLDIDDFL
jgi:serine/threonine protein kinase